MKSCAASKRRESRNRALVARIDILHIVLLPRFVDPPNQVSFCVSPIGVNP